jgi:hypothetical protein
MLESPLFLFLLLFDTLVVHFLVPSYILSDDVPLKPSDLRTVSAPVPSVENGSAVGTR